MFAEVVGGTARSQTRLQLLKSRPFIYTLPGFKNKLSAIISETVVVMLLIVLIRILDMYSG